MTNFVRIPRWFGRFSGCLGLWLFALGAAMAGQAENSVPPGLVRLPVEVVGPNGTIASVTVTVPTGAGGQARALWMQVHNLEYADMASVRVNDGAWQPLNNRSVSVAEPGKSYGGIGGGFATLKLTLALPPGSVVDGVNTVSFRFNRTDGAASGFRVLAFNFLAADGRRILPVSAFTQDDPDSWVAPLPGARDIAAGERLWRSATLTANGLAGAGLIRAHCGDCHARDGRDLKYFNYSNASIAARCRFHGLSQHEGEQVASYIRALAVPNPGRPWNPPFQPGPGQAAAPVRTRSAGAGVEWALDRDVETLRFLFPAKGRGEANGTTQLAITPAAFAPDSHLDGREVPIALQLPDWNHWLPRVHPMDAWGERFDASEFARVYRNGPSGGHGPAGDFAPFLEKWLKARGSFLAAHRGPAGWTPEATEAVYSAQLWQLVKTWEMTEESLDGREDVDLTKDDAAKFWSNSLPAATAPAAAGIPDGPNGMGGSALTNEYFDNAWYAVQLAVMGDSHRHHGRGPMDWPYLAGRIRDLDRESGTAEPGRLLLTAIRAMQSTDPQLGPENLAEGWRPDRMLDPRILISRTWAEAFSGLSTNQRRAVAESFVTAWLEKTERYPVASYFQRAQLEGSYVPPKELRDIFGGKVWLAAPELRALGVSPALVDRLEAWGRRYSEMAGLFHY